MDRYMANALTVVTWCIHLKRENKEVSPAVSIHANSYTGIRYTLHFP